MTDEELIYLCAFRYAFGRRTYITKVVSSFIRSKVHCLSTEVLELLMRELGIPFENYPGDLCDKHSWNKLCLAVAIELAERKNK